MASQLFELLWEADVVADCHAYGDAGDVESHKRLTRAHRVGFLVIEGVISVDFVVTAKNVRPRDERSVAHAVDGLAITLNGVRWAEHAQHHGDTELLRHRTNGGHEVAFEPLCLLVEATCSESLGGSLRQHDELRAAFRGLTDFLHGQLEVLLDVSAGLNLHCSYQHDYPK